MPRVLIVEHDMGSVGGALRALHALLPHVDRERYECWVTFRRGSPNPLIQDLRALGCQVATVGPPLRRTRPARAGAGPRELALRARLARLRERCIDDVIRLVDVLRAVRSHRIDLIHANNNLIVNWYVLVAAALTRRPLAAYQRFYFEVPFWHALARRLRVAYLCISHTVRDRVAALAGSGRLLLVYDGVEVPAALPTRAFAGASAVIAMVGRLVPWKGPDVFLRAAPAVLARFPEARFELIGAAGGHESAGNLRFEASLRALAEELGIADRVTFRGFVRDVDALFRDHVDVVVHAATVPEPFGLVVAEGMAAGRPVVAPADGGCAEVIEHDVSGLLFRPGDAADLAAQLIRLLGEDGLGERLRRAGFERVRTRFDVKRTAAEVQAAYAELLAEAPKA